MTAEECALCSGAAGDLELFREQVWEDRLWRLSAITAGSVPGFSWLEPKRHIPHIVDLDGEEAATFGSVLARVSTALKEAAGADLVYVYVFGGGIPHLHVHLAPHRQGDALSEAIIRGGVTEEKLPSGMTKIVSREFPARPAAELRAVADTARRLLAGQSERK